MAVGKKMFRPKEKTFIQALYLQPEFSFSRNLGPLMSETFGLKELAYFLLVPPTLCPNFLVLYYSIKLAWDFSNLLIGYHQIMSKASGSDLFLSQLLFSFFPFGSMSF